MYSYVFTCGDINGIGPEIVIKTINKKPPNKKRKIIFICPKNIFEYTISQILPNFSYVISKSIPLTWNSEQVLVLDIGNCIQSLGKVTKTSGKKSYYSIIKACELAKGERVDAIITAPISKYAFVKAGIKFPGHTELLAEYFNSKKFTMMFVSNIMKAGIATIHIPIDKVSKNINKTKLKSTIKIIISSLKEDFRILNPKIAFLGLNPHAGENGNIGSEEEKIIKPVINSFPPEVSGPFVPDAFFGNRLYANYDCTIGLYHDQILIPFKLLNFNKGVNFTAGLPIVRTSPDHGTAFDIAGKGIANPNSMIEAFRYAEIIVKNRKTIE